MKPLPQSSPSWGSFVLRTDFSDEAAWHDVCSAVENGEFYDACELTFLSDAVYSDITPPEIFMLLPEAHKYVAIYLVDSLAVSHPDHPLLVIDLYAFRQSGSINTFRSVPAEIAAIECNLSIANMDFEEFADAADDDGIFWGFED